MATIDGLLNGAKKFLADLESGRHPQSVFQLFEKDIVAMNTDDQLFKEGENALGVTIRSYQPYSPVTISIKQKKGQPTNRVTLRDTQAFHNSFFIYADNRAAWFKATDKKSQKLYDRYGEIFGLTVANRNKVAWEYLYPLLMTELKNCLNG